jgi:hypothetical protein
MPPPGLSQKALPMTRLLWTPAQSAYQPAPPELSETML